MESISFPRRFLLTTATAVLVVLLGVSAGCTQTATFVSTFGSPGSGNGHFSAPLYLAINQSSGNI